MAYTPTTENGKKAQEVFKEELALIRQERVRDFVLRIFDALCPDHFWERECSLSGKYHPQLSQGKGGLVRHVKYACWWGVAFSRSLDGDGTRSGEAAEGVNRDYIIGALIVHDLLKDGDPELAALPERQGHQGHSLIVGCHGVDLCEAIWRRMLKGQLEWPEQEYILMGVAAHMGVWTIPAKYRPASLTKPMSRKIAQIVHIADMAAAQKADQYVPTYTVAAG